MNYEWFNVRLVFVGFSYNFGDNMEWVGVEEIWDIIKIYVDFYFVFSELVEVV